MGTGRGYAKQSQQGGHPVQQIYIPNAKNPNELAGIQTLLTPNAARLQKTTFSSRLITDHWAR
jgi:hypothetical protein